VTGWFIKAADFIMATHAEAAFVTTNSICQGVQVPTLWPVLFKIGVHISFAYPSFQWSNLASHNAGVTVSIIGLTKNSAKERRLFDLDKNGTMVERLSRNINGYLVFSENISVSAERLPPSGRAKMRFGNHPYYANSLILTAYEARGLVKKVPEASNFIRPLLGSKEAVSGNARYCLWIDNLSLSTALKIDEIRERIEEVRRAREAKIKDKQALALAEQPYRFRDQHSAKKSLIIVPIVSSENRPVLPVDFCAPETIVHNKAFALYDAPLFNMALIASRLHWVWIGTVCVRLEMRFSYSNTLGWNTFPVPTLTEQNKTDLTRCAENILLAREAHYPATIADLYDPKKMPEDLRAAHDANDETLERIYIGRRFKNDTERLEKLFELYTKMTSKGKAA